jgi:hypothetical protein
MFHAHVFQTQMIDLLYWLLRSQDLSIPKDEFWDIMKKYALRSKYNCLPDFEQIQHHIKDESK